MSREANKFITKLINDENISFFSVVLAIKTLQAKPSTPQLIRRIKYSKKVNNDSNIIAKKYASF